MFIYHFFFPFSFFLFSIKPKSSYLLLWILYNNQGRIQYFKLGGGGGGGGGHLKKLRRAEGGAKIVGVFRVKNHDFTPKNHIFSNFRGGGGGRAPGASPLDPPPDNCLHKGSSTSPMVSSDFFWVLSYLST